MFLKQENALRTTQDNQVVDQVLLVLSSDKVAHKIDATTAAPFQVTLVSRNRMVNILRGGYEERVNIRQL